MPSYAPHHRECLDAEREAAELIAPARATIQARVLTLFREHGPMTDEELLARYRERYGPIMKNSLEPRRCELVDGGHLEATGERRKGQGRVSRTVWRVAGPSGQLALSWEAR